MNGHPTGILTTFPGSRTRCITPDIANPYCSRAPRPVDATGEAVEAPQVNGRRRENWRGVPARQVRDKETGEIHADYVEAARAAGVVPGTMKWWLSQGHKRFEFFSAI